MPTFRVMTYNVLRGAVGRENLVREVVRGIAPDVAVFCEIPTDESVEAIGPVVGPHRIVARAPLVRQGIALVSRWPILEAWLHGPPWAPRKWIDALVRPFDGAPVRILAVHLPPHQLLSHEAWRGAEVRLLLQHLRSHHGASHIVAGDFNSITSGDWFRRDAAPVWVKAQWWLQGGLVPRWALRPLSDAGYIDCYRTCKPYNPGFTIVAWNPAARIDYIFASPDLRDALRAAGSLEAAGGVESGGRVIPHRSLGQLLGWKPTPSLGGHASDHLPVWADFEWVGRGQ